ncbi:MAG: aminoglycoside phosphotransferase family protein [Caldilineaceae bacterium]
MDLDIEQPESLIAYLRNTGHLAPAEQPTIQVLAGGVSNRTVLVERAHGEAWVLKQALSKLRVPVDWFSSPERVHREAMGLRWLAQLTEPGVIPRLIFEDHQYHLLAMAAVPQPHANWKTMLLAGHLEDEHITQFAQLLGTIHQQAFLRAAEVAPNFQDRSFFESLRLEPYYHYTATQQAAAAPFLEDLIAATRRRCLTLVHGDYSPKNTLVYQGRLILLDYEVIHWGDPAFDVGFALTHLLSKAHHLPALRARFSAAAQHFWQHYYAQVATLSWATDLERYAVRHTLGCLLARVAGRSPLEYLNETERQRQAQIVTTLMQETPATIDELTGTFGERLNKIS